MKQIFTGRFQDKVMIITGAAQGIGAAIALRAAKEGAKLVLVDRLKTEGERTLVEVKKSSHTAIFLCMDVSVEENAKEMEEAYAFVMEKQKAAQVDSFI